jgi:hypothetical protein
MKKLFALAALVLGLASCQKDTAGLDVIVDGEQETTISVSLPEATRANSAESGLKNVDLVNDYDIRYILEIYDANKTLVKQRDVKYSDDKSTTFDVRLIPGYEYNFVVWADFVEQGEKEDNYYNTANGLTAITVNNWEAMAEARDAYTGVCNVKKYSSASSITIPLVRPFAKLRVITTDVEVLTALDNLPTQVETTYSVPLYKGFNALNETSINYDNVATLTYNPYNYGENDIKNLTLLVDYIFCDNTTDIVNFSMKTTHHNGMTSTTNFNTDIPLERNKVTTIKGNILTDGSNIKVNVEDGFDQSENVINVYNGVYNETITLTTGIYYFENVSVTTNAGPAIQIAENSEVTINVKGNLKLNGATDGIAVADTSTLTINGIADTRSSGKFGNLNVVAKGGYGIGGIGATVTIQNTTIDYICGWPVQPLFINDEKYGKSEPEGYSAIGAANITLDNVHIKKAEGGSKAAAIGNRFWQSTNIVIKNSTLEDIFGGNASAAIGGSRYKSDLTETNKQTTTVRIENSTITNAVGGQFGAGIGSGYDTHCAANATNSVNEIVIINSSITAKGGKYAAGIGTGFHAAALTGSIDTASTIDATSGEPFYKGTYTFAQHIGYGVIDPEREGADLNVTFKNSGEVIEEPVVYTTYNIVKDIDELKSAIDAATSGVNTIVFGADIEGNLTIIQKQGVEIAIDGAGHKFNGYFRVHSNSNYYTDAALTIKNLNFETSTASVNFIEALENGSERYSCNITAENCTFTATGAAENTAVGVQIKASKNAKVIGCIATGVHSLIQAQSCDETVVVKDCTINGKNGVAFKQVKAATVEGTTITATGYGIRFDGNTDNYGITVKNNNNVTASQPFIVRRMTGANNTITLEGTNTLITEAEYKIVITNGEDDEAYVKPTGTYTLTGADNFLVYPRDYELPVASWNEFTAALAAGETEIKLTADITYDANYQLQKAITLNLRGYSMTLPMINIHTKTTVKNGTINGKVYARKNAEIVFDNVKFSGAVADNLSTEGHLAIQGGCKSLYAKDCLFSPTSVSGSQTKPLSFEGGSTVMKFENCEFKSSPYKKQVYLNSLSATGSLEFVNCNFNYKTPNIMLAAACPFTNVKMSGTTKLSSVTLETNRAKDAITDTDLAYLRELIANNSFSSVRLFYAGGSSEYIQ